ncbi:CsbD family protein [Nocardia goodfellowii]
MSNADKAKNKADQLAGQAKEKFGRAADEEGLENEGVAEQAKGSLKQLVEKVKDAFPRGGRRG